MFKFTQNLNVAHQRVCAVHVFFFKEIITRIFLLSSYDAKVQLLLFYVCQNLGQDFKLSSGKIPTLSAPSGRKRILSFVSVPCTAFPIWPLEPILPQRAVFQFPHSKYFASNIFSILTNQSIFHLCFQCIISRSSK